MNTLPQNHGTRGRRGSPVCHHMRRETIFKAQIYKHKRSIEGSKQEVDQTGLASSVLPSAVTTALFHVEWLSSIVHGKSCRL